MLFNESLYPVRSIICKGIQDSLVFWIPRHGFGILCPWNLDSWFQLLVEFQIPLAVFRIPKYRIPILQAKNIPHSRFHKRKVLDSGIRIPSYMGRIESLAMSCSFSLRKHPLLWKKRSIWVLLELSSLADEHNTSPKSTRRHVKLDKFIFGFSSLPGLLCNVDLRHQYGISVAESQTSPAAKSKEKLACVAGVRKGRGRGGEGNRGCETAREGRGFLSFLPRALSRSQIPPSLSPSPFNADYRDLYSTKIDCFVRDSSRF